MAGPASCRGPSILHAVHSRAPQAGGVVRGRRVSRPRICRIVSVAFVMRTQLRAQLRQAADAGFDVTMVCSPSADLTALSEELGIRSHGLTIARQTSPVQDLLSLTALTRFFAGAVRSGR